jgi:hypothetical protein
MKEVFVSDKQQYLTLRYPFSVIPGLDEIRFCIQCKKEFVVGDYKVLKHDDGFDYIHCPNYPACHGTVIDWVDRSKVLPGNR